MSLDSSNESETDWPKWRLEDLDQALAKLYEQSFHDFVQAAWPIVEAGVPFRDNWHILGICRHLEAVKAGKIKKLLINVPPGCMKSLLVGVFWPAWTWITWPESRWLFASYGQDLSTRDSVRCRTLIESEWYRSLWGDRVKVRSDQNQKTRFENTSGGWRMATSIGGRGTGQHPTHIVVDDPHSVMQSGSNQQRQAALDWWDHTMSTRGVGVDVRRICIMQRLNENDLSGHILGKEKGWTHLCLPMRYEAGRMEPTPLGWTDQRATGEEHEGEILLWPSMFSEDAVQDMERNLGPYAVAGQLQQRPSPEAGGMFSRNLFRYFKEEITEQLVGDEVRVGYVFSWEEEDGSLRTVTGDACSWFQSIDTAQKTGEHNAYTVVMTICITPPPMRVLVYDVFRQRIAVPQQFAMIVAQRHRFPNVQFQAVEEAASGIGILQEGYLRGVAFRPLKAIGSKEARCGAIAAQYASKMVYHKAPDQSPWLGEFEHELLMFPNGRFSDQVDCLAHGGLVINGMRTRTVQQNRPVVLWPQLTDNQRAQLDAQYRPKSRRDQVIAEMFRDDDDDWDLPTWGR